MPRRPTIALLEGSKSYWTLIGQCTQCGHCKKACESLTAADMTLGEIARSLLDAERASTTPEELATNIGANPALVQAVRGCFLCTSCKNTCLAHNDVCDLIHAARVDFQRLGLIPRECWSSVLVDQEWDIFTAYRAVHGIYYQDLTRHRAWGEGPDAIPAATDCEVAFFPGCSLVSYGPELTREIFATVEELGGKTTLIDSCCGSSLKSAGFYDRAEALCDRIAEEIRSSGARELVCVCPGCANAMRAALERNGLVDVEVIGLAAFLTAHGFTPKRELPDGQIFMSKSCSDRDGSYLEETCELLGFEGQPPTIFNGCCGAGGAVSAFQPERQAAQADSKLSFAPDGSTIVTMCPTCTYTYAFRMMESPRAIANKHYAELLFESFFDWDTVFGNLNGMWYGEYGAWLAQVLG